VHAPYDDSLIATVDLNKKLQRGLVPEDKALRVANFAKNMVYEVGMIVHSCGVREPQRLRRYHARIVLNNGLSIPLSELHPEVAEVSTSQASGLAH
jgi:hypothetical protein